MAQRERGIIRDSAIFFRQDGFKICAEPFSGKNKEEAGATSLTGGNCSSGILLQSALCMDGSTLLPSNPLRASQFYSPKCCLTFIFLGGALLKFNIKFSPVTRYQIFRMIDRSSDIEAIFDELYLGSKESRLISSKLTLC